MESKMNETTLQSAITRFVEQTKDQHIQIKGQQSYLKVVDRLNFVRQTFGERICIDTATTYPDGLAEFNTKIFLDGKLIATGQAKQTVKKDKEYEKVASVSIGRALAVAGFAGNELATYEEMKDFVNQQSVVPLKTVEIKPASNQEEIANDVIDKLEQAAKFSKTSTALEKQKELILNQYKTELEGIKLSNSALFDKIKNRYTTLKQEKETNQHGR
jgi:urease beta subunit